MAIFDLSLNMFRTIQSTFLQKTFLPVISQLIFVQKFFFSSNASTAISELQYDITVKFCFFFALNLN